MSSPKISNKEAILKRQERVAQLRLKQLSMREIANVLESEGFTHAKTGKPFTYSTVSRDLKALDKMWTASANKAISAHKARQLAEITEAKKIAWSRIITADDGSRYNREDIGEIRRLIELEAKLLGTNAADLLRIGNVDGEELTIKGYVNVSPDDWDIIEDEV